MPLDERPESVAEQTETPGVAYRPGAASPGAASPDANGTASGNGSATANATATAESPAVDGTAVDGTVPDGTAVDGTVPDGTAPDAAERPAGAGRWWLDKRTQLAFASFLMLFAELALIRWTAANNVYVTNATNFVLLASFLGIGLGFLNARSTRDFVRWSPLALVLLVAFVLAFPVILATLSGPHPYQGLFGTQALPRPVSLAVIFVLSTAVMAGFGQAVARLFVTFEPLKAYRLDILGSIVGTAAFTLLSFLELPPVAWGVIAAGGLVLLLGRSARWWQYAAAALVVVMLAIESAVPHQQWSPYYKISAQLSGKTHPALYVSANNIPYQAARSLTVLHQQKKFYFYPYQHVTRSSLKNVLIVGAGTGNDVAVALSEGAQHVDAVEIDPVLIKLGRSEHPNHPYDSPRVTTHNADGRAFLQNTTKKYNLILFALPDSLTAVNGQSNLRLESYLLTEQSVQSARAHLAPGGTMSMYNYYSNHLYNRYATTMLDAFGQAPCSQVGPPLGGRRLAVLTDKPAGETVPNCTTVWHSTQVAPATDDHPFPYLLKNTIPSSYVWMLALILAASLIAVWLFGSRSFRKMGGYIDLAFMGAAFLLLETKNIVQFALLFGSTWLVNALVTVAILVAVYLAVETARHVKLPPPVVLYAALIASLVLTWLIPQDDLLTLPIAARFLAGGALAFAPVFIANLIFAQRFSDVETTTTAFAANLLGAMVGGALEYLALITGYRFLLILVGVLYALAFGFRTLKGRSSAQGGLARAE
jgi:Spermine/spermidine synthase domain